jgi:hypothetical protein
MKLSGGRSGSMSHIDAGAWIKASDEKFDDNKTAP